MSLGQHAFARMGLPRWLIERMWGLEHAFERARASGKAEDDTRLRIFFVLALFSLGFVGGASVCAGWVTVRPGMSVQRVEAAFHEELARLATELVSDDELDRAKALTEADELGALQRVEERADRLSMYATLFDRPGLINEMLPRYLAVTPEQIRDVAAAVFREDNRLVLTYLPDLKPADDVAVQRDGDAGVEDEEAAA